MWTWVQLAGHSLEGCAPDRTLTPRPGNNDEEAAGAAAYEREVGTFVERYRALRACGRASEAAERGDGRGLVGRREKRAASEDVHKESFGFYWLIGNWILSGSGVLSFWDSSLEIRQFMGSDRGGV